MTVLIVKSSMRHTICMSVNLPKNHLVNPIPESSSLHKLVSDKVITKQLHCLLKKIKVTSNQKQEIPLKINSNLT